MRFLSLLVTLLVVAWLVYTQLGGSAPEQAAHRQAEAKAEAVNVQVQDQFSQQADQLSRMESGGQAGSEAP